MYSNRPFYNLSFSSLTVIIIVPSEDSQSQINAAPFWSKPCLQVELENEDPLIVTDLKISGKNKTATFVSGLTFFSSFPEQFATNNATL